MITIIAIIATATLFRYSREAALYLALIAAIVIVMLYPHIDPGHDYSDGLGGTSQCASMVSGGYDATWLVPFASDVKHQIGTTCWAHEATA